MKTYMTLPVLVLSLTLAGCGGGDLSSPESTMETFFNAAKSGDKEQAKSCFLKEELKEMKKKAKNNDMFNMNFTENEDAEQNTTNKFKNYTIHNVKTEGDRAVVKTSWDTEDGEQQLDWVTKNIDGQWKISIQETMQHQMDKALQNMNK